MIITRIKNIIYSSFFGVLFGHAFKKFGKKTSIIFPLDINGMKNISIGNNVRVSYKTWLAAVPHTGEQGCQLIIGDGVAIGNFNHIYATKSIIIESNVLIADKVYISDNLNFWS